MKQTTTAAGHTSKHVGTSKHTSTSKHTPAKTLTSKTAGGKTKVIAVALPVVGAKAVGLSPGEVQCCAAQALATSARLAGHRVSDEDVLALYWHTASDPEAGASVEATMEAAWRYGLGGVRPRFEVAKAHDFMTDFIPRGGLILGVELPGPHAVLAAPDGWWSWGEPFNPADWPGMVVEEAWAVSWS